MGWVPIKPAKSVSNHDDGPVTVKITPASKRTGQHRLVISVRPDLLPKLTWWRSTAAVAAAIGTDEHRGSILVEQHGAFRLSSVGPHGGKVISLFLPLPDVIKRAQSRRLAASFDTAKSGAIEIRLPHELLTAAAPAGKPVSAAPPAPPVPAAPPAPPAPSGQAFRTAATTGKAPVRMAGGR